MIPALRTHVTLLAHAVFVLVAMACWLEEVPRPVMAVVTAVVGAVVHTLADTIADPRRGGDNLRATILSDLCFSAIMAMMLAILLPPL